MQTFPRFESDFLDGNLYLNTNSYFGTVDRTDSARFDPYDGVDESRKVSKVEMQDTNGDWLPLPVVGPITVRSGSSSNLNILCMFTVTDRTGDYFDDRNLAFGDVAIVIDNLTEFIRRVEQAATVIGRPVRRGPIEYVDRSSHDGPMGPFRKYAEHRHQNEFRFVFANGPGTATRLPIGSIRDIAHSIRATEVSSFWKSMLAV